MRVLTGEESLRDVEATSASRPYYEPSAAKVFPLTQVPCTTPHLRPPSRITQPLLNQCHAVTRCAKVAAHANKDDGRDSKGAP